MAQSTLEKHPDYVQAIGMISIENANLEIALAELFARVLLIGIDVGEAIYLTPRSAFARLDTLKVTVEATLRPRKRGGQNETRKAETLGRSLDIHDRAKKVIGRRHEVIHNTWGIVVDDPSQVARTSLPRIKRGKGVPAPSSDLNNLIRDMRALVSDTKALNRHLKQFPPTLVDMRIEPSDKGLPQLLRRNLSAEGGRLVVPYEHVAQWTFTKSPGPRSSMRAA
jgi:hypothetical protein